MQINERFLIELNNGKFNSDSSPKMQFWQQFKIGFQFNFHKNSKSTFKQILLYSIHFNWWYVHMWSICTNHKL